MEIIICYIILFMHRSYSAQKANFGSYSCLMARGTDCVAHKDNMNIYNFTVYTKWNINMYFCNTVKKKDNSDCVFHRSIENVFDHL